MSVTMTGRSPYDAAGPSPAATPGVATAGQVLALVRTGRAATRADVGRLTGLSRTAVSARLATLLEHGLVLEGEQVASTGGRPAARLRFNRDAGVVLAAAIGRSRTQLAVCDLDGTVLASVDRDQEIGLGPDVLLPLVVEWFRDLLLEAGRDAGEVWAVGLSLPGTVDTARGVSVDSPVMAGWDGVDLVPYLSGITAAPLFVDNDANVLALSEVDGHLRTFRDALVVKASTGFGLGVVADGRVVRGHLGAAGEIGHVKIESADGLACRCGDTGCLEAVGAGWAVVQRYNQADADRHLPHVRDLVGLALRGDPEARGLIRDSGRRLGEALAGAVNVLNPEAIVVGGDMGAAFDMFAAGLRETLYPRASALATSALQVLPSTYGDRAGVVGCASLALGRMLSPRAVDARLAAVSVARGTRPS